MHKLSDMIERKFTDIQCLDDFDIECDLGWEPISSIMKTIPYTKYEIFTDGGKSLKAADDHIIFDENLNEIFVKNLVPLVSKIMTDSGAETVISVVNTGVEEEMFDIAVDSPEHRFYSNGILSHNTSIINALCYAFYNKPFDNISLQRLINTTNNAKNTQMEVRVFFSKGDDEYEIYRCRGESVNIQVLRNGEDITIDSVMGNDRMVQEIVGISYELFTKTIIFSGNSTPFLQMPISQQRGQIEELFNITLLTEKAIKLKDVIKSTEGSIAIQEAVSKEQEAQVSLYNKQLKDAELRVIRWEDDRVKQVATLEKQLGLLVGVNIEEEKELHTISAELVKQEQTLLSKLNSQKRDLTGANSEIKKLAGELNHLIEDKCPYCLQQYAEAAGKLDEKQQLLESKQQLLTELSEKIKSVESESAEITQQRQAASSMMKFSSLAEAVKAELSAQTAQGKIDDLVNAPNPHIEAYEQLKHQSVNTVSYHKLDELKKELEHQQFLLKLLVDKNSFVRRKIISKTIPFLNNRLVYYTKELGLPHVIKFDDDMSCTLAEYGRDLDFGNLSSGEKKRVNLSMSLAFRDVLHQLHSKFNCLFIDEIDASLDTSGVENTFKLLKNKTRDEDLGMWIISHRPEAPGRFDRTVIVRKENGFSRILYGESYE